jgi:enamine deaminase RidA (YjgF/YER057c/UK114 family)
MPQITPINPWTWQDAYGFSQAVEVRNATRTIYCAGQASVDEQGAPLHAGDMIAQLHRAVDNLETVLAAAGLTLKASAAVADRLRHAGCNAPGTLLGIAALFHPDILIELEATAAG